MKTNKEKFLELVSKEQTNTIDRIKERIKNRKSLRESQEIAIRILKKLEEPGWSQRRLAREMSVSPQQITKIVKGKENLTLETIVKLQEILNIPILATFYERAENLEVVASVKISDNVGYFPLESFVSDLCHTSKSKGYNMNYDAARRKYEFEQLTA